MSTRRDERLLSSLSQAVAEFISRESNRTSLITVTKVELANHDSLARIFVSVLPVEQAHAAIDFLTRQEKEARDFLKKRIQMRIFPKLVFQLDPEMGAH
jgi:ribosome-binding factor A